MKFLSIIFFMSLIAFSLSNISKTTFDLKSGQTVQTGSNVKVKITVQITGDATDTQDFKTGTFTLQKTDNETETATLTCNLATAVTSTVAANGTANIAEAECTVDSLTTAGTYKLSAVTAATSNGSDAITTKEVKTTTPTTLTVTEAPAGGSGGSGGSGDGNTDGAKFLTAFYSLISLILFL